MDPLLAALDKLCGSQPEPLDSDGFLRMNSPIYMDDFFSPFPPQFGHGDNNPRAEGEPCFLMAQGGHPADGAQLCSASTSQRAQLWDSFSTKESLSTSDDAGAEMVMVQVSSPVPEFPSFFYFFSYNLLKLRPIFWLQTAESSPEGASGCRRLRMVLQVVDFISEPG